MKLGANQQKMAGHDGRTVGLENKVQWRTRNLNTVIRSQMFMFPKVQQTV